MAAELVATPDQCIVGTPIVITGTGFDADSEFTLKVTSPNEYMGVKVHGTTDGTDLTTEGLVNFVAQAPGTYTFTADDGTNVESATVEVAGS